MPQQIAMEGTTSPLRNYKETDGSPFQKGGKNRARSHTQPASLERNEARQRRLTLLYDASQLRADCRRCHVVTIESSCDRELASTCKPAARTGFSPL
ncbi:hypothetical protein HPB51_015707 [Rhipicephalus microplus]|uniref:Uncharacterized protein n=1 Tax=Rhipicephalus microplus TaxID=6941 RepID=A0A9J6D5Q4_RHIMP|nr:hypothetical protein HPB51_015707 [Rhipicephalus microplus]